MDQRGREVQPPLHPARVGLRAPVGRLGQAQEHEELLRAPPRVGPGDPVEPALELEQLASRLDRIEPDLLERDADPPADLGWVGHDVDAGHAGRARGRRQQRAQHPHRGRLARAVRAEEAEHLARAEAEVDSPHGLDTALEGAVQAARLDGIRG